MTYRRISKRWMGPTAAAACLIFPGGAASVGVRPALALVNESPSLPRGLYVRNGADIEYGTVVAVPQPRAVRPYLASLGMPEDVLLIKRVAAVGGDRVCAGEGMVRTPARMVVVHERDRQGASLPGWRDCRVLARDELFLLGDTAGSFDSRYFGPVRRRDVVGVFREVLTW